MSYRECHVAFVNRSRRSRVSVKVCTAFEGVRFTFFSSFFIKRFPVSAHHKGEVRERAKTTPFGGCNSYIDVPNSKAYPPCGGPVHLLSIKSVIPVCVLLCHFSLSISSAPSPTSAFDQSLWFTIFSCTIHHAATATVAHSYCISTEPFLYPSDHLRYPYHYCLSILNMLCTPMGTISTSS